MKQTSSSRREFLKHTAVAAGAVAALQTGFARSVHAAGSNELKIALIGCGGRGTGAAADCMNAAKILGQPIKLVAVADAFEDRARRSLDGLKQEWAANIDVPPERVFVGLDAYQKAIDCGVDLVLLATPPGFRPLQYTAAVKAGKNVFMEKPLCTDAPGFRTIMAANELADQKNLKVVVGLQRHHQAGYLQGIQEIHDGKLGDVEFLRVYWNGSGGGARDLGARPQNDPEEMKFQIRNWGCFLWLYGDNIVEQHVHNIDIANWVMNRDGDPRKAHPVEANGMGGRVNRGNYGHIFDHHTVEFTYADGIAPTVDMTRFNLESGNPYVQEHVDLMKAISADKKLQEGWHGAASSMTAVLGRMATHSGVVVKWDEAVEKGPQESPEVIAWDAKPRHMPGPDGFYPFPIPGLYKPY